ncbi:MAG: ABC transporter permease [Planctomycetota bacterium]|nr:ABC transporter permease [Planctomycetota bacterium]
MMFLIETFRLGLTNLRLHLLRSVLTALGIILGVAAVITMVSIGEGSKQQALLQIEALGAKNIILRSQKPPTETAQKSGQSNNSWISRFGITREDLKVITANFPDAEAIVPLKAVGSKVLRENLAKSSQAFGTTPDLIRVANLRVARGRYLTQRDLDDQAAVCVVGHEIARQMFPLDDPLGQTLRVDQGTFEVIGVLEPVGLAGGAGAALVGRDLNLDVHMPITTAKAIFNDLQVRFESGSSQASQVEISEIYLASPNRDRVLNDAARLSRLIEARHESKADVSMNVPYELLESAKKSALTGKVVSGAVAGISLLVGGIGIMNIMLATVTERTREIGIRRAVGATRRHIRWQFIVETSVLSMTGGLIGVAMGPLISLFLEWAVPRLPQLPLVGEMFPQNATLPTAVTLWSIVVAFGVATLIGLVFGIYPASKAAKQDPIVALRHD